MSDIAHLFTPNQSPLMNIGDFDSPFSTGSTFDHNVALQDDVLMEPVTKVEVGSPAPLLRSGKSTLPKYNCKDCGKGEYSMYSRFIFSYDISQSCTQRTAGSTRLLITPPNRNTSVRTTCVPSHTRVSTICSDMCAPLTKGARLLVTANRRTRRRALATRVADPGLATKVASVDTFPPDPNPFSPRLFPFSIPDLLVCYYSIISLVVP